MFYQRTQLTTSRTWADASGCGQPQNVQQSMPWKALMTAGGRDLDDIVVSRTLKELIKNNVPKFN